ncbi:hypothetical protein ACQKMK_17545 [Viridibacillus arvi]|uniref:hypothetical protein n=1 Tax=Viridibacillus arvi TaxID=263475 RepID=UPI003D08C187
MGTDLGIYCVLYFKVDSFSEPKGFNDSASLLLDLNKKAQEEDLGNICIIVYDCTEKTSVCKL